VSGGRQELAAEIRSRLGPPPELAEWPLVSLVVLNRNGVEHLPRLLAGLVERTDYPSFELVVVDNGSSDESLDFIRSVQAPFPISILANAHNESFSDANNQGAELASGELLLFLNNDIEPFELGWLRDLVACLCGSQAGAVGSTLIEAAEQAGSAAAYVVQQRGLLLSARHEGRTLASAFRGQMSDPLGEDLGRDFDSLAIAGACMLIDRRAFEDVGGFTHGYVYGGEDVDLSLKLRSAGFGVLCSGRSVLVHAADSIRATAGPELGEWLRGNRRFFLERWGPRMRREYELGLLDGGPNSAELEAKRAEVEALAYCFEAGAPHGYRDEDEIRGLQQSLSEQVSRRGHRCLALWGKGVDDLRGLEYDVAVHLRGPLRYVPRPGQLNVLWSFGDCDGLSGIECSRYDLVVSRSEGEAARLRDDGLSTPVAVVEDGEVATTLLTAVEARVREIGFRTRIG
jgi:GT2 family glycosyltransferase